MRLHLGLLLVFLREIVGARILAFIPLPIKSHHIAFQPILRALAEKGHEVDYVTGVPMPDLPKTLREIRVKDMLADLLDQSGAKAWMDLSAPGKTCVINDFSLYVTKKLCEEDDVMKKLIKSKEHYDMILMEAHFSHEYAAALLHKFNALGVSLFSMSDSAWVNEMAGLPDNPSYMLDFKASTTDKMTFTQRVTNLCIWVSTLTLSYYFTMFDQQKIADKYFQYEGWQNRPPIIDLMSDMALILVNSHHSISYPYPKAPHVKEIAGVSLSPGKPLPKDLQEFMDSATDGVIYFSYGGNVDVKLILGGSKFDAFLRTFRKLKQKVLWKWTGSAVPKVDAENVIVKEWFPQQDILAHNNTRLFITHGGLMSTIEAVNSGVPLIGTAVFGDQHRNIQMVKNAGIGIELAHENISDASVSWAITEILANKKYKTAMQKRSELFKDRPMKPVDEAVYWIEFVLRHGKVLQPASVHMPFYQVYMLDIIGTIFTTLLITAYLTRFLYGLITRKTTMSVPMSKKTH